jgi:hypothetical protein
MCENHFIQPRSSSRSQVPTDAGVHSEGGMLIRCDILQRSLEIARVE